MCLPNATQIADTIMSTLIYYLRGKIEVLDLCFDFIVFSTQRFGFYSMWTYQLLGCQNAVIVTTILINIQLRILLLLLQLLF